MKKLLLILSFGSLMALFFFHTRQVGACSCPGPEGDAFSLEIETVTVDGVAKNLDLYKPYEVTLYGWGKQAKFTATDPKNMRKSFEADYVFEK